MINVDEDLSYDDWRTRGPEPDAEAHARERWEDEIDILELLGDDIARMLLWDAYVGGDVRPSIERRMNDAWEEQKRSWSEL